MIAAMMITTDLNQERDARLAIAQRPPTVPSATIILENVVANQVLLADSVISACEDSGTTHRKDVLVNYLILHYN